jgi:hypothetical protein
MAGCADVGKVSSPTSHSGPRFSYTPYCDGGTCTRFSDEQNYDAYTWGQLLMGHSNPNCESLGGALMDMVGRGALYIRSGPDVGLAGRWDGTVQPYMAPEEGDTYVSFGEAWVREGPDISAEDNLPVTFRDKVLHEAAHAVLDPADRTTNLKDPGDVQPSSITAHQLMRSCS